MAPSISFKKTPAAAVAAPVKQTGFSAVSPSPGPGSIAPLVPFDPAAGVLAGDPLVGKLDYSVSMTKGSTDTSITGVRPLLEILEGIRIGEWKEPVELVRAHYSEGGKQAARPHKEALVAYIVAGKFTERKKSGLISRSGLIGVDIDPDHNPGMDPVQVRETLHNDPYCMAAHRSATCGVRGIFRLDPARPHQAAFTAVQTYLKDQYGFVLDKQCGDVSRQFFVSFDPDSYIADSPVEVIPYPQPATVEALATKSLNPSAAQTQWDVPTVREVLKNLGTDRPDYDEWLQVISGVKSVLPQEQGIKLLKEVFPEEQDGEYESKWDNGLSEVSIGTLVTKAKENGWKPSDACARIIRDHARAVDFAAKREALIAKLTAREFGKGPVPVKPIPRFLLDNVPLSTPGNLTTITAQAKSGKSALVGAFIASAIVAEHGGHDIGGVDTFGITSAAPGAKCILHIDTEQSPYDHHQGIVRAIKRAGMAEDFRPSFLRSFCLAGLAPRELVAAVNLLTEEAAANGGIFAVVIDGVADLVAAVNDDIECNAIVAELHDLAIRHECVVMVVIHENPAQTTGKARGHLGSQLERKSETNLRLMRDGPTTVIFADKTRGAPIPQSKGPRIEWNDHVAMHVRVHVSQTSAALQETAELRELAEQCFPENCALGLTYTSLRGAIEAKGVKRATAERRIKRMVQFGVITTSEGLYQLAPVD